MALYPRPKGRSSFFLLPPIAQVVVRMSVAICGSAVISPAYTGLVPFMSTATRVACVVGLNQIALILRLRFGFALAAASIGAVRFS
jgi:hypothetical protein